MPNLFFLNISYILQIQKSFFLNHLLQNIFFFNDVIFPFFFFAFVVVAYCCQSVRKRKITELLWKIKAKNNSFFFFCFSLTVYMVSPDLKLLFFSNLFFFFLWSVSIVPYQIYITVIICFILCTSFFFFISPFFSKSFFFFFFIYSIKSARLNNS